MPCSFLLGRGCRSGIARLAETAPQAIWHLPLLTAGKSPNQVSQSVPPAQNPRILVIRQFLPRRLPEPEAGWFSRLIPKPSSQGSSRVPPKHPPAQDRKLRPSNQHHDKLTQEARGEMNMASHPHLGTRLTASLAYNGTTAHQTHFTCCAVACLPSPILHSPSSPGPLMCVLTNQPDPDTQHATPINMLCASRGWELVLLSLGPCWCKAPEAMCRTCLICRTAQQQEEVVIPQKRLALPSHVAPHQPRPQEPPKFHFSPIIALQV